LIVRNLLLTTSSPFTYGAALSPAPFINRMRRNAGAGGGNMPPRLRLAFRRRLGGQTSWPTSAISGVSPCTLNRRTARIEIDAALVRAVLEFEYPGGTARVVEIQEGLVRLLEKGSICSQKVTD
jgi:hypothetical protein